MFTFCIPRATISSTRVAPAICARGWECTILARSRRPRIGDHSSSSTTRPVWIPKTPFIVRSISKPPMESDSSRLAARITLRGKKDSMAAAMQNSSSFCDTHRGLPPKSKASCMSRSIRSIFPRGSFRNFTTSRHTPSRKSAVS